MNNKLLTIIVIILLIWNVILTSSVGNNNQNTEKTIINEYNVSGFSTDFTEVVDTIKDQVVSIHADNSISSGFIYKTGDKESIILCSYHGVANKYNIEVVLDSLYKAKAEIVGYDIFNDVAVLRIEVPFNLPTVTFTDSSLLKSGEFMLAMGTPTSLDYRNSVELSMVSSPLRTISNDIVVNGNNYNYYRDVIQLSGNIFEGYSGSGLFNMNGEIAGMISMKDNRNTVFAVPADELRIIADAIIEDGFARKLQLGIKGDYISDFPTYVKTNHNIDLNITEGIYIDKIKEFGVGSSFGLRAGDVIVSINDVVMNSADDYLSVVYSNENQYRFVVIRGNDEINLTGYIND